MALLNYQNVGVSITPPGGAATQLQANNVSISFQVPIEPVRALGQKNAIAEITNGPAEGTINIDYIIVNSDPGRNIFTTYINSLNPNGAGVTNITIGGRNFPSGYLTSYSLSAEPNSIINASLSFNIYGPLNYDSLTSSQNTALVSPNIAHGSQSSITNVEDAIGFDYNATIDWEPIFILNRADALLVNYVGAQETLGLRGNNLAKAVTPCPGTQDATVNIRAICNGTSITTIAMTNAKIQDSELSVQAGGFVEGSYTLVKNY